MGRALSFRPPQTRCIPRLVCGDWCKYNEAPHTNVVGIVHLPRASRGSMLLDRSLLVYPPARTHRVHSAHWPQSCAITLVGVFCGRLPCPDLTFPSETYTHATYLLMSHVKYVGPSCYMLLTLERLCVVFPHFPFSSQLHDITLALHDYTPHHSRRRSWILRGT